MDIHDPHRIALLPVRGGEEQPPYDAGHAGDEGKHSQGRQDPAGQAQETAGIGEAVQAAPPGGGRIARQVAGGVHAGVIRWLRRG